MAMTKPTLDEMIEAAAELPPGLEAWELIFEAYPEVTPEDLIEKFRQSAERAQVTSGHFMFPERAARDLGPTTTGWD